jgi:hypothetical protein
LHVDITCGSMVCCARAPVSSQHAATCNTDVFQTQIPHLRLQW